MACGIYGIFDVKTDVCLYIGQSRDIERRYRYHLPAIKRGKHSRKELMQWVEVGHSIYCKVLEVCVDEQIAKNKAEVDWFNKLQPAFYGVVPTENYIAPTGYRTEWFDATCSFCGSVYKKNSGVHGRLYCSPSCGTKSYKFKTVEKYPQEEDLRVMYLEQKMTTTDIAQVYGCSQPTISSYLKKYNIPTGRAPNGTVAKKKSVSNPRKAKKFSLLASCGHPVDKKNRAYCDACLEQHYQSQHKIDWPSLDKLLLLVEESGYAGTGRILGVSNNTVKKHIKKEQEKLECGE